MSFYHSQLQLIHSCITTLRGLSQKARKKRMFFRTFFTWKNTFFATLRIKQQKQVHMSCFWTYKHSCMLMYISSKLLNFSLYKYKHIARQFSRAFNIQKEFNLSPKNSILSHVNIQRSIHRSSSTTTKQTSNIFHLLYLRYHYKFVLIISPSWDII